MYRILKAEMIKSNISVKCLAFRIGITERSLRNKINGITEFTLTEAIKVHVEVAPKMSLESLFEKSEKTA